MKSGWDGINLHIMGIKVPMGERAYSTFQGAIKELISNQLKLKNMNFGQAIEAAKEGKRFRLAHWKEDVTIQLQVPDANSKMTHPYLYVKSRYGLVPWIPTMIEILSENWEISV